MSCKIILIYLIAFALIGEAIFIFWLGEHSNIQRTAHIVAICHIILGICIFVITTLIVVRHAKGCDSG